MHNSRNLTSAILVEPSMIPSSLSPFTHNKVVLFFETAPLSDNFQQIKITHEDFKKFTKFMFEEILLKDEKGSMVITEDTQEFSFPNIPQFYTKESINTFEVE